MSDKNYRSSNLIKKKKKVFYFKTGIYSFLFILIIAGLSYLSNLDSVKISTVEVNDTSFFDKQIIIDIVNTELNQKYFWLFNKNNILLMPSAEIEKKIKASHQTIKNSEVSISGLTSLSVQIEEYQPMALWCLMSDCYYLNEDGFVFARAPFDYDRKLVQFHDWLHGDPVGQTYTDADTFKKMLTLITLIAKVPLNVVSVNTEDGLTFYLYTDSGTRLLYEINDNPEEVANNLNTVLEKDAISKAQLNNIEYIDLRFGNKVYYKIR